ncbi:formate dehydrogenase accessory sulfurtransferase FdhD [Alicyclobacillus tolerans]|uniref:Sulfur carrier protein FdhD n=2 Tax=Alicyclobacillus tolerans TaxID=90970 RepID=A0ABT9LVM7_9BACL|nr:MULTISPECIES: formate dehydrogenase accessory sulfurtransferase FdhD [Alicyclobacillus]MDP9728324.1 FdhD protein [Alicyclobacillus tengchongensis]QRF23882.1 formate dehydrogenase accessory sulfurtransferase FdhD [Alicyclobacillus sp. TC]SHJ94449.1 FdhD protein [Alicyclobacillus montanus]
MLDKVAQRGEGRQRRAPLQAKTVIQRYHEGQWTVIEDSVANEFVLTIEVDRQEFATVVCTPDCLEDFVIGFLASEGVIRQASDVDNLEVSLYRGMAWVHLKEKFQMRPEVYRKRYITSCCGKSRQSFYFFNDAQTAHKIEDSTRLSAGDILNVMAKMDEESFLFKQTGGVHMAFLEIPGQCFIARSDIGRHNALDKVFGYLLRCGLSTIGARMAFSGRISSEVLLKVSKMGVGVVISHSAPTQLALDLARDLNITVIGFVRNSSFNVYTHDWRVQMS